MKKSVKLVAGDMAKIYVDKHVSRSAAELSYFLTLSVFPACICLYAMMSNLLPDAGMILEMAEGIVPGEALATLTDYLGYVTGNESRAMLIAGILMTITTSAAAFRSIHNIMGDIQGEPRFKGLFSIGFSIIISLVFLAVMYFAVIVIVTGDWFLNFLEDKLRIAGISGTWNWLRFVLLFALLFVIIYGIYRITAPREMDKNQLPGAALASVTLVLTSMVFSMFIGLSSRYPLVYGSLASIVILMLWLYICGIILIMGNALNVVLRNMPR